MSAAGYSERVPEGLNSDLNLNTGATPRVRPGIGEWGPMDVLTTRKKKRMRWWTILVLVGVTAAVVGYAFWIYTLLH